MRLLPGHAHAPIWLITNQAPQAAPSTSPSLLPFRNFEITSEVLTKQYKQSTQSMTVTIITSLWPVGGGKLNEWFVWPQTGQQMVLGTKEAKNLSWAGRWPNQWQGRLDYFHLVNLFISVQSLSRVRLFATPWTAAGQASLSITISRICRTKETYQGLTVTKGTFRCLMHSEAKQTKTELEQRKFYCRATNSQKGFSKALLKTRWERGVVNCCILFCIRILWSCSCPKSGHDVPVNLEQDKCYSLFCHFLSL